MIISYEVTVLQEEFYETIAVFPLSLPKPQFSKEIQKPVSLHNVQKKF